MNRELIEALEMVEKEKGISKEILIDAIESALSSAYKKDQKQHQNIKVKLDPKTGDFRVFSYKQVVEEVADERLEMSLADARRIDPGYELNDQVEIEIFPSEFGRIAAQTAKQVVAQRIREAERSIVYDEFASRVGDIVNGVVQRHEQRNVFVELGRVEAILPQNEQIPGERYEPGMRIKTYLVEVKKSSKGPQVILSRTRNGLLKRLFELEVPEIQEGLVEIKSVAREPGARSKIAVASRNENVDPVGACVGAKGARVQMIVRELKGEKIDVIPWSPDPETFIIKALSPSKVSDVKLFPSRKTALVIVPDYQLSLAIGKEGQNARLAAKLTGWKIDIKSESQAEEAWESIQAMLEEEEALQQQQEVVEEVEAVEEEWAEEEKPEFEYTPEDEYYPGEEAEQAGVDGDYTDYSDLDAEDHIIDDDDTEEEEIKKKVKKPKTKTRKREQEFVDEMEEGFDLFNDLQEEDLPKVDKPGDESEVVFTSESSGFTLGQLLAAELQKKAKEKAADQTTKKTQAKSGRSGKKKGVETQSDEG